MTGDQQDMLGRLKAVLPSRWFGDQTPVLDALLGGLAASWCWVHGILSFVAGQTRIATAQGLWLDLIANDFFGDRFRRRVGQSDAVLRANIQRELFRERATRLAIVSLLRDLTGRSPVVFEPARPTDTGGWGVAFGYGSAGGWGNLNLPFQCFVTAARPFGNGIAQVAGWGTNGGGYGTGSLEYGSLAASQGQVTDADIYGAIATVLPVACTAWTRIIN